MHSSSRINFFPAWKQLFGAFSCLQAPHGVLKKSAKVIDLHAPTMAYCAVESLPSLKGDRK